VNELVLEQFASEIQALPMPKFLNWNRRALFKRDDEETVYLRVKLNLFDTFTPDLTKPLSSGGTVTFVALQIAYYMGFSEVILIGVDHNFADTGTPNKTETRRSSVDFPKGRAGNCLT
jgi:hypothetical protein